MVCKFRVSETTRCFCGPLWPNHHAYSEQRNKHEHGTVAFLAVYPRAGLRQGSPGNTQDLRPGSLDGQDGAGIQLHEAVVGELLRREACGSAGEPPD